MNAIIYTRFSPRPDASESESCETQRRQCEEFAAKKGYTVRKIFDDPDRSGADEARENLWLAIRALKKGEILIVYKRDRLARSLYLSEYIAQEVMRRGAKIEAVSGDISGEGPEQTLVRQVVAAMAEYERKLIARRTSDAMRALLRSGRVVSSRTPYGYMLDPADSKRVVENPKEMATLKEIGRMHREGMSINSIARSLDPATSRCGRWHPQVIWHIVKNRIDQTV